MRMMTMTAASTENEKKLEALSKKYKISVNQQDITMGKRNEPDACPVKFAISRATGKECSVVTNWWGYFYCIMGGAGMLLNDEVSRKIKNYDQNGTMEPFEFELEHLDLEKATPDVIQELQEKN